MHAQVAPAHWIYQINERLYHRALDDLKPEDASTRVGGANSMLFVAGHLLASRHTLLGIMNGATDNPWRDLFGRGAPHLEASVYPPVDEIMAAWDAVSAKVHARFENISGSELAGAVPYEFPVQDQTVLGAIAFLAMHESFHVGQFSFMRKLLGYETLAG